MPVDSRRFHRRSGSRFAISMTKKGIDPRVLYVGKTTSINMSMSHTSFEMRFSSLNNGLERNVIEYSRSHPPAQIHKNCELHAFESRRSMRPSKNSPGKVASTADRNLVMELAYCTLNSTLDSTRSVVSVPAR